VNKAYCQPPVWWYTWLVKHHLVNSSENLDRPRRIFVVTADAEATLTKAVLTAIRGVAPSAVSVVPVCGSLHGDLGVLMRAGV
jgi:hypothetical protein